MSEYVGVSEYMGVSEYVSALLPHSGAGISAVGKERQTGRWASAGERG